MSTRPLTTPEELVAAGLIDHQATAAVAQVARRYPIAITPRMAALIDRADPADPIARQFVPTPAELAVRPEELADPIGDGRFSPVEGIVHRYPDRVLLLATKLCAVYCRFCFRRDAVGPASRPLSDQALAKALDYVREHPALFEVILSGGDPLVLSARRLGVILRALDAISHIGVIRLHTRVPLVAPERLTAALLAALKASKAVYAVLHVNHPRELTAEGLAACRRLQAAGVVLLSQTVLLKGVNAEAETLAALFRALVAAGIKPYYLHHPDLAAGTAGFRLDPAEGQALVRALRGTLSGLCQPTYVLDIPGGAGKVPIGPAYLEPDPAGDGWLVTDPQGRRHPYPKPDSEPRAALPNPARSSKKLADR